MALVSLEGMLSSAPVPGDSSAAMGRLNFSACQFIRFLPPAAVSVLLRVCTIAVYRLIDLRRKVSLACSIPCAERLGFATIRAGLSVAVRALHAPEVERTVKVQG